ncbi:MAG: hypothetical protein J6B19_07200 [Lachnospiraceae bacterium]|nr:hypothetical protein [Lachnospiraceae bacterium]
MSDKFTKIFAIFALLFLAGIMISAILPDSKQEDLAVPDAVSEVLSSASDTEKAEESRQAEEIQTGPYLYYYNALSPEEQTVYDQMYEAIIARKEVKLDTKDKEVVSKIFECVTNDHPEIFYCSAYQIEGIELYGKMVQMNFSANYHMTEDEVQENFRKIEAYVESCISSIPTGADDYTKVKCVYEYIINHTEYVPNSPNNQNVCSVFIGGESVCMGYAKATQYILDRLGIDATLVYGHVGSESHSWNLVRVDGECYYMDPTWGDAGYVRPGQASASVSQGVNYEYFLITTEQLSKSHVIDNVVSMPACVATRNNYYIREGLYLHAYEEATISAIFDRMKAQGERSVSLRCSDAAAYQSVKNALLTEQKIFRFMDGVGSVSYSYNDDLYTLIFWIE